ncbi:MAG: 30S ribosomal protein S12 methylthiotransferase RimO [Chromatiales bacterium]|jgi:ribosomal protein S12 methylthiotransferase|nr:30S ribosomal protein S12 methylthiotransferase RimO [Chromatiales bacterium]
MSGALEAGKRVGFVSLGCPKALVDSERILTQLRVEGYDIVGGYADADLVVVNTCGFIDEAVEESLSAIDEAIQENGRVIVTGCLGANPDTILSHQPKVLAVTGPQRYEEVMAAVHEHLPATHDPLTDLVPPGGIKLTPRHYAYLKISEGCNHHCSFCIIPSMRGKLVSRPAGDVLREATTLVEQGVRELLVISQDTSAYGVDTKYRPDLFGAQLVRTHIQDLAKALGQLDAWVRLHYVYPYPHVDELVDLMVDGYVTPYLDVPFQHGSPKVLKAMRRPAHAENTLERVRAWREKCPDLAIRSTFIVGFPGETDEDFETLLNFLREAQIDRAGCFRYSPVDGAAANELPGAVSDKVKHERFEQFMTVQTEISTARLARRVGKRVEVLIDEVDDDGAIGRTQWDAPEVDGRVFLDGLTELPEGTMLEAVITDSDDHDLWATPA